VNIINCTFADPPIGFGFPHIGRREILRREKREYLYYFMVHLYPLSSFLYPSYVVCGAFISAHLLILVDRLI
jgi:hypothetical protein